MYNDSSSPALINVLIIDNRTGNGKGGGMYNTGSSPTLTNVTMAYNTSNSSNEMYNASSSSPIIRNSIIWHSDQGSHSGVIVNESGCNPNISYSAVQDGGYPDTPAAGSNFNISPDTIGFTNIYYANDPADCQLVTGSPAINAGHDDYLTAAQLAGNDCVGNPRKRGGTVDMGALELQEGSTP
jgi:hypothetical protein